MAYACFCEVDKEMSPVADWCAPCRKRATERFCVFRLSTKLPVLGSNGGLLLFHARHDAVEWIAATIGSEEAIGRYAVVNSAEI